MRTIQITNESTVLSDSEVQQVVEDLQTQLDRDFYPAWGCTATLVFKRQEDADPSTESIHVLDDSHQADALGYHDLAQGDVPEGFCFAKTSLDAGDAWSTTLSHELLEQLVDPYTYSLALATWQGQPAALALEVCDPVEGDTYQVGSTQVSNFILPTWFVSPLVGTWLKPDTLVDFLGRLHDPLTMTPGGYQAYTTDLVMFQQTFAKRCAAHHQGFPRLSRRERRIRRITRLHFAGLVPHGQQACNPIAKENITLGEKAGPGPRPRKRK